MKPMPTGGAGQGSSSGTGVSSGSGSGSGSCNEATIRAQLGNFSSGNGCVDGCISSAVRCAGAAGCVLTSSCQNAEISCVEGCYGSH